MTDPTEPTRYAFEYPDEAGYPDGKGTLSQDQAVLIDEVMCDDDHGVGTSRQLGIQPQILEDLVARMSSD